MPLFIFIFFLLFIGYLLLIDYYSAAWKQLPAYDVAAKEPKSFVSVIIAARNEADNLPILLDSLRHQDYPTGLWELIIIDDHSTDKSWQILEAFVGKDLPLRPYRLKDLLKEGEKIAAFKKRAIEAGIELAKGSLIVCSDADCYFNPQWLRTLAVFQEENNAQFIAAPVHIVPGGTVISRFQSLDFLILQGITGASVFRRFHSMCNGANLAYTKAIFEEVGGFRGIDQIPSGDDMLLMHKIARTRPESVFYLKSRQAIVQTAAMTNWKSFFQQRIRWASKTDVYDDRKLLRVLILVYLLNACFLFLGIASFFPGPWWIFFCVFLLAKIMIEYPFVRRVAQFFDAGKLLLYFIPFQPAHILYTVIAGWLGRFGSYEWKMRRIKK